MRRLAFAAGFDGVGFALPQAAQDAASHLAAFLREGRHGDMGWMSTQAARRMNPLVLWPGVKSVVMLGLNYAPGDDPLRLLAVRERGAVSVYAQGRDYHDIFKRKLKEFAGKVVASYSRAGEMTQVKLFVDTAPVMEKPLAAAAGLGWQGKHTNLVSRDFGSWLFLGALFTDLELEPDLPERDSCGSCQACLDACPTRAFPQAYELDARRCISYLTIEHKGHIAEEFREAIGNRIYGCDDCLSVCPWNKFARRAREIAFAPRAELTAPHLADLAELDEADFRKLFSGSPIKRTGRDRFIRNVLIAIGNSGDPRLINSARRRLNDTASIVRAMAVWALGRLCDARAFEALRDEYEAWEKDAAVRQEWRAAQGASFAAGLSALGSVCPVSPADKGAAPSTSSASR
jgi:epoxyqueuosine reductase